jgi:hypothetical protein
MKHSDKTIDVVRGTPIVNVSLGCTRTFRLKKKDGTLIQKIPFVNNSLFIMGLQTNREFMHSIKRDLREPFLKTLDELSHDGQRISLTFRYIGTFITHQYQVYGLGAKNKTLDNSIPMVINEEILSLVKAFAKENSRSDFNWDENYGGGFDVVDFQIKS